MVGMALYVVLRHQRDNQSYVNAWLDDELIEAIQTPTEIEHLCQRSKEHRERVYIHRCGWEGCPPVVCCSAEVAHVSAVDNTMALVCFASAVRLRQVPPRVPVKGQNFYIA